MIHLKFLLFMFLVQGSLAGEPPVEEQVRYVMGTTATVQAWAPGPELAAKAVEAAYAAFDRVDSLMSTWRDDSVISSLNRSEPGQWVEVGPEVCRVLREAKTVATASQGAFDPTVLPLVRLWGFRGGQVALPDSAALAVTRLTVDHRLLEVDLATGRARLLEPGMAVDLGGIAKGYGLDIAAAAMRRTGATGGVIDLGGNILTFGQGPNRKVGIVDPTREDRLLTAVALADASVATSGQYERYLTIQGRICGHILDPRTGWPVSPGVSATVVAEKAVLADALATAAVVLGADRGLALLEMIPGVEGLMTIQDGHGELGIRMTSGFVSLPVVP
jgi:thiamine biosynthesis lipoprotein